LSALPIVIVGAGLAGLNCARLLQQANRRVLVLDAADGIGGRVRTDRLDGFLLDRGFQVLQCAYPEAQAALEYPALQLQNFEPGARIRTVRGWAIMADPWRRPSKILQTLFNEVGTPADRWRLAKLRRLAQTHRHAASASPSVQTQDMPTIQFLSDSCRFSSDFIERFLRPWIRGMFFDEQLETSSQFFQFVFSMLADGDAALPNEGMGAIPAQLARNIPSEWICCNTRATSISDSQVVTSDGVTIDAAAVVLATDGIDAQQLSKEKLAVAPFRSTTCLYFSTDTAPAIGRSLVLNGQLTGPISNVCVPSNIAARYAPPGKSLICVSIRPEQPPEGLERKVHEQLSNWFGPNVASWQLLRRYDIARAIPSQRPGSLQSPTDPKLHSGIFICGDHCRSASIQGALLSGRLAAEAVLNSSG
jgi:phytoene dehydrogenase-like protein